MLRWGMPQTPKEDPLLPYPLLKHHTRWPGVPLSEEYLIPPEDKQKLLEQLYPFVGTPSLEDTLLDIHENREFVVRDFKVVREGGMNMLVSPYYYNSGGSVIDWVPPDDEEDWEEDEEPEDGLDLFGPMTAQQIKPGGEDRLVGLMSRQHEGRGL